MGGGGVQRSLEIQMGGGVQRSLEIQMGGGGSKKFGNPGGRGIKNCCHPWGGGWIFSGITHSENGKVTVLRTEQNN